MYILYYRYIWYLHYDGNNWMMIVIMEIAIKENGNGNDNGGDDGNNNDEL